jgi:RecA-family ATPase
MACITNTGWKKSPREGFRTAECIFCGPHYIRQHNARRDYRAEIRPQPVVIKLSDVTPEPIRWSWKPYLALGKQTLIIGDPGFGKSTMMLDIACRVTRGKEWVTCGERAEIGNVILLVAEDGLADTVRPRVDLHGGAPERIHVIQAIKSGEDERPFSLANDVPHLEAAIESIGNVKLVIIDPISAYLGGKDSYKDSEVRSILTPLASLAEKHRVAIVSIAHLGKSEQRKALYRPRFNRIRGRSARRIRHGS